MPKLRNSAVMMSVLPDFPIGMEEISPKFCVELGVSIMLDKPIITGVHSGSRVPAKLAQISDRIIEWDPDPDVTGPRLNQAMEEIDAEEPAKLAGELAIIAAPWVPAGAIYIAANPDGSTPTFKDIVAKLHQDDW